MIRVGVIGLGMMGNTHLDVYSQLMREGVVQVVAVSDAFADRLSGKVKAAGNIEGQAQGGFELAKVKKYTEGKDLINDPDIDLVDICLPTHMHLEYATYALSKGKHVLCEKPMARTAEDAEKLAKAAAASKGIFMIAMCMRFWPGWTWLKEAVDNKTYGKVLGATFRRVSNHPGGAFYKDGKQCGGAALDLHIHDTDFIQYCFGKPKSVSSQGYSKITGEIDHIITRYQYDHIPFVAAEGGWVMSDGHGFKMLYTVNFENATATFDIGAPNALLLATGGKQEPVKIDSKMGYELEIRYFVDCIVKGIKPTVVTPESAGLSVKIVEAEVQSVKENGAWVKI